MSIVTGRRHPGKRQVALPVCTVDSPTLCSVGILSPFIQQTHLNHGTSYFLVLVLQGVHWEHLPQRAQRDSRGEGQTSGSIRILNTAVADNGGKGVAVVDFVKDNLVHRTDAGLGRRIGAPTAEVDGQAVGYDVL